MPSHGQHVGRMPDDAQPGLTHGDHKEVEELSAPRAPIIYEVVRRQGEEELDRPDGSLRPRCATDCPTSPGARS